MRKIKQKISNKFNNKIAKANNIYFHESKAYPIYAEKNR